MVLLTIVFLLRPAIAVTGTTPEAKDYQLFDSFFNSYQPYLGNISACQPVYFLGGANPEDSAFQFSMKYRFYHDRETTPENLRWLNHLYFAYTQTSFWDLKSDSKPFEDTSYKPEVFYLTSNFRNAHKLPCVGFFLQCGYQHESNGQADPLSRSTNYLYVQPIMIFYHKSSGYGFQFSPKLWCYIMNSDKTNPDFPDYRGYADIQVKFGKAEGIVCDTHLWIAKEGLSGQFDFSYPVDRLLKTGFNIYFYAQYANRLAESMRYYKDRSKVFRAGFSIVR